MDHIEAAEACEKSYRTARSIRSSSAAVGMFTGLISACMIAIIIGNPGGLILALIFGVIFGAIIANVFNVFATVAMAILATGHRTLMSGDPNHGSGSHPAGKNAPDRQPPQDLPPVKATKSITPAVAQIAPPVIDQALAKAMDQEDLARFKANSKA